MTRWIAVLAALLACHACQGKRSGKEGGSGSGSAPATDRGPATGGPLDLSFVKGTVVIAERRHGKVRPVALDPATGAWTALGGGDAHLFPTGLRWHGGLLAIATWGEHEADHAEQLAVVRGAEVELIGPRATMVRNPSLAGGVLVFESSQDGFRDLYRLDDDGAAARLTDDPEGNLEPAVSPDGTTVAFTSSRDGQAEIYRMPAAGGAATRLTAFHKDDWSPAWSPDGTTLLFLSDREGTPRVFLMSADGTGQRRVTFSSARDQVEAQPRWSPDGHRVALLAGEGARLSIQVLDGPAGELRTLTPSGFTDSDFAWSPDSAYLVVSRHPLVSGQPGPASVALVRASDGAVMASDADTSALLLRWLP